MLKNPISSNLIFQSNNIDSTTKYFHTVQKITPSLKHLDIVLNSPNSSILIGIRITWMLEIDLEDRNLSRLAPIYLPAPNTIIHQDIVRNVMSTVSTNQTQLNDHYSLYVLHYWSVYGNGRLTHQSDQTMRDTLWPMISLLAEWILKGCKF